MKNIATLVMGFMLLTATNIAFSIENKSISANDFLNLAKNEDVKTEVLLLDVRTVAEYGDGHIPGAINIPVAELPDTLAKLNDKSQQIVVYCRSGKRAGRAINFLAEQGYQNLVHLEGDYSAWEKQGLPIEKP